MRWIGQAGQPHRTVNDLTSAAAILGRKGGQSKSTAKITAARKNGKKGGRPKKVRGRPGQKGLASSGRQSLTPL